MSVALEKPKIILAVPPEPTSDDLGMVENGQIVRVGEMLDEVEATLKPTKDVYEFKEDSPVENDSIQALGWESGKTNVGVLTLRGRLVLAIRTIDSVTEQYVNEIVAEQERNFGKAQAQVLGATCHYRFWARGNSRLMVCDSMDAKDRISVSVVIGQYELMDKLGMSGKQAEIDQRDADQILVKSRPQRANP